MIPDHVAAYAMGCRHASGNRANWTQIARFVFDVGLGEFNPVDLGEAAHAWAAKHIGRETIEAYRQMVASTLRQQIAEIDRWKQTGRKGRPS